MLNFSEVMSEMYKSGGSKCLKMSLRDGLFVVLVSFKDLCIYLTESQ